MAELQTKAREETPIKEHIGRVLVSRDLIDKRPDLVCQIFWQAIPVRAEMHYTMDQIEYHIISRSLPHMEPGSFPPTYRAVFNGDRFVGFEP